MAWLFSHVKTTCFEEEIHRYFIDNILTELTIYGDALLTKFPSWKQFSFLLFISKI